MEGQSFQPVGVVCSHGLGKDGDAESAGGQVGDCSGCAGLEGDVGMYAFACAGLVEDGPNPGSLRHAHNRMGTDFGEGDPVPFGQRVVERDGGNQLFADEGERFELGGWRVSSSDQRQVDLAGSDPLDESVRAVLDQSDLDARMGNVERRQDVEQWGDGASRDHPDREAASDQPIDFVDGLAHGVNREQCGPGMRERRRPCGGEGGVAAGAVDKRGTEIGLELADWALTPDWLMCTRSAARVKFASSATATRYSSCLSSMTVDSRHQ